MNRNSQVLILCEDTVHYHFARKYFQLLGFKNILPGKFNPKGRSVGSGAAHVINNYKKEVNAFHAKVKKCPNRVLVIIVDDDTKDNIKDLYQIYKPSVTEKF